MFSKLLLIGGLLMSYNAMQVTDGVIVHDKEAYFITQLHGDEVYGVQLNGDGGIFLYQNEAYGELKEGDTIVVSFGDYEDDILSVEKIKK